MINFVAKHRNSWLILLNDELIIDYQKEIIRYERINDRLVMKFVVNSIFLVVLLMQKLNPFLVEKNVKPLGKYSKYMYHSARN